jgi:hypothetical protein
MGVRCSKEKRTAVAILRVRQGEAHGSNHHKDVLNFIISSDNCVPHYNLEL